MTNTTSIILVSVGQAVVSSSGSTEVASFFVLTVVLPIAEHKHISFEWPLPFDLLADLTAARPFLSANR